MAVAAFSPVVFKRRQQDKASDYLKFAASGVALLFVAVVFVAITTQQETTGSKSILAAAATSGKTAATTTGKSTTTTAGKVTAATEEAAAATSGKSETATEEAATPPSVPGKMFKGNVEHVDIATVAKEVSKFGEAAGGGKESTEGGVINEDILKHLKEALNAEKELPEYHNPQVTLPAGMLDKIMKDEDESKKQLSKLSSSWSGFGQDPEAVHLPPAP